MEQDSNHRFTRSHIDQNLLQEAAQIAGADNAEPLGVRMATVIPTGGTEKVDVTLLAINPGGWLASKVTDGSPLSEEVKGRVLVDQTMVDYGVKIGTTIEDQASGTKWIVDGFVKNESFSHTPAVFLNKQDWVELQAQATTRQGADPASSIVFNAIAIKAVPEKVTELQAALPNSEVITKSEAVSAIPGYKEEQGSLMMMIAFLFVISAFVLAVFFYVITIQKTSQFGILKAIGTRTAYLAGSVALQVFVLSVGSLSISVVLIQLFKSILPSSMPFQLEYSTLLFTCLIFIAMSLVGSLFSVWKVTKIDALDAIGRTMA
ncbi:ABC transporter permease [Paenibacillus terrae]